MNLQNFKNYLETELKNKYPQTEISSFFKILMKHYFGFEPVDCILNSKKTIVPNILEKLENDIVKLQNEIPIQYILGEMTFYNLTFQVDESVLIPRPETEELVAWILDDFKINNQKIKVLDIGTGSGCIAISLAKHLKNCEITALDFCENALKIAKKNAEKNIVNINFLHQDILKTEFLPEQFDIIVSNPPYVRELEKQEIQNNVLQNEPHSALFVPDKNPLIFYEKITDLAKQSLAKNGVVYFEINQYLGTEMSNMLLKKGCHKKNILLKKDVFENDRMIKFYF